MADGLVWPDAKAFNVFGSLHYAVRERKHQTERALSEKMKQAESGYKEWDHRVA